MRRATRELFYARSMMMSRSGLLNANETKGWKGISVERHSMDMMKASGGILRGKFGEGGLEQRP